MNNKTKAIAVLLFSTGMIYSVPLAHAQTPTQTPVQSLIERIASRFGLANQDVQNVFVEHKQNMMNVKMERYEEFLTKAVQDKKITEAQKKLLIDKYNEFAAQRKNEMNTWLSMTPQERADAMKKHREELESWAKSQNIDLSFLWGVGGPRKGMMKGMGGINGGRGMHMW